MQLNLDQCVANLPAWNMLFEKIIKNKQSMLGLSFLIILLRWIFIYLFILETKILFLWICKTIELRQTGWDNREAW